jgi:hypothetical protein
LDVFCRSLRLSGVRRLNLHYIANSASAVGAAQFVNEYGHNLTHFVISGIGRRHLWYSVQ